MSFREEQFVPGFEKRLAAYVDDSANSWWVGHAQFWIASLLDLTWPYRWYFRYKSGKTFYTISKKIYLSRPKVSSGHDVMDFQADTVELPIQRNAAYAAANDNSTAQPQPKLKKQKNLTAIPV